MGLFGRKKNKAKVKAAEPSTYAPPEDPSVTPSTGEVAGTDDDIDLVKVASVGVDDPSEVEEESMIKWVSSYISVKISALKGGGDAEENVYSEHEDGSEKKPFKDDIMDRVTTAWAAVLLFWFSLSKVTQVALLAGAAVGAVGISALAIAGGHTPSLRAHINVAFVGNSYFYVNDLPRFVEKIAGGHITQDSVIHNAATILQIVMTGNGMWNKWATRQAMIGGVKFETSQNTTEYLYDMGACSVPQLLTGHDKMLTYSNKLGTFIDDGQNPCFNQDAYLEYQESTDLKKSWDFVVITDQSTTMAFEDTRQEALAALNYTYGPILKEQKISPVIVQPHAYSSSGASSSGLDDLTTFTALIMEGAQVYRKFINKRSGWFTKAHVAPVGNAFLAIYEESPNDLWPKLFLDDGIHPSAYGTFVYGCVIYATMTGYMPKYSRVVVDDMESSDIFATARRLQSSSSQAGFPTKDEAKILYKISKKVAVNGYKPKALRGFKIVDGDNEYLRSNNDNVYDGSYNGGQQYANGNDNYNQMYENQANYDGYYENDNANGDYNYGNDAGDDANNGNYNYQVNNYNYNNGNDGNYGDADADAEADEVDYTYNNWNDGNANADNGNNQGGYQEAAEQYYQQYGGNNKNNNDQQQFTYGGGNTNGNQFYYQDLKDDDVADRI